jgi:hypothetical protein
VWHRACERAYPACYPTLNGADGTTYPPTPWCAPRALPTGCWHMFGDDMVEPLCTGSAAAPRPRVPLASVNQAPAGEGEPEVGGRSLKMRARCWVAQQRRRLQLLILAGRVQAVWGAPFQALVQHA